MKFLSVLNSQTEPHRVDPEKSVWVVWASHHWPALLKRGNQFFLQGSRPVLHPKNKNCICIFLSRGKKPRRRICHLVVERNTTTDVITSSSNPIRFLHYFSFFFILFYELTDEGKEMRKQNFSKTPILTPIPGAIEMPWETNRQICFPFSSFRLIL